MSGRGRGRGSGPGSGPGRGRGRGSGPGRGSGRGSGSGPGHEQHSVIKTLMGLMQEVAATGNTNITCMLAEFITLAKLEFETTTSRAPRREVLSKSFDTLGDNVDTCKITQFKRIWKLVDDTPTKSMWTDTLASEYLKKYGVELNMYGYTLPALIRNTRGVNGVTSKNYPGRFFIAVKGDPRDEPEVSDEADEADEAEEAEEAEEADEAEEAEEAEDEQITFTPKTPKTAETVETTEATETNS